MNKTHIDNKAFSKEKKKKKSNQIPSIERKKQGRRIALVSLGLLISFGVATCLFLFFEKNAKTLFLYAVNQEYADFASKQPIFFSNSANDEAKKSTMKTTGSISLDIDSSDKNLHELEKYSLDYTIFHDYIKQNLFYQLQLYYDEKTIADLRTYGKNSILYLELKNLFSKYISVEIEQYENIFDTSTIRRDDIDYMIQNTKNLVLESLHEDDFIKTKEKVLIDGKVQSIVKISYVLNEEKFKESYKFILESFLKDEKALEIISKYMDIKTNEVKKILKNEKNNIQNKVYLSGKTFYFFVYFKSLFNEPIKYEIALNNKKLEYFPKENEKVIRFIENNEQKAYLNIKDNNIKYAINDKYNIEGNLKMSDKKLLLSFNDINNNVIGNITITKQNKYNGKIKAIIRNNDDNITINGNYKSIIGQSLKLPKNLNDNSISHDKLTEEHYNEIMDNISKNDKLNRLFSNTSK